ncbi:MAG: hypothetical protein KC656_28610, partial [Myxococcales bacterium]|nr:hypothetical protein [Myxococcales bacterium]
DLPGASELQARLLRNVSTLVKPGGVLVYAVCSPEPEEGEGVVRPFLEEGGFRLEAVFASAPPTGEEDAHQAFVLRREGP